MTTGPVGFDTETHLILPGSLVPPLVCLTLAWTGTPPAWLPPPDPACVRVESDAGAGGSDDAVYGGAAILTADAVTVDVVAGLLAGPCVAANAPFDLAVLAAHAAEVDPVRGPGVLRAVFETLAAGRVSDVQVRERLLLNARGVLAHARVSLADLVFRYLGEARGKALHALKGPDTWRTRYDELDGVPLDAWPEAAVAYAVDDARLALEVHGAQNAGTPVAGGFPLLVDAPAPLAAFGRVVVSEDRELRAAWALHLMSAWGLRVDAGRVDTLVASWRAAAESGHAAGVTGGWVRGPDARPASKAGTLDKKALQRVVADAFDGAPPTTAPTKTFPAGQVKTDTATILEAASRAPADAPWGVALRAYGTSLRAARDLAVWGDFLEGAREVPLCARYTHLVRTGRTSAAKPPVQQLAKNGGKVYDDGGEIVGVRAGIRECFIPRPGYALVSVDYDTAELAALAQVHEWMGLGDSLARAINAGMDVHCLTAEAIARAEGRPDLTYDVLVATRKTDPYAGHLRQLAKVANFGFPGGLGATRFVEYAAKQDPPVVIDVAAAARLREAWFEAWPEMRGYFDRISRLTDHGGAVVQHPVSGRLRGGVGFTDGANGFFQGLVADGAKAACWDLAVAAYVGGEADGGLGTGAFYGARPVAFLHDEVVAEVPWSDPAAGSAAADEMARIMRAALQAHIPGVRVKAEPAVMRRWYKAAATVRDGSGRLVPWAPPEDAGTGRAEVP